MFATPYQALPLLFFVAGAHGALDLTLVITREVRGAAFPVDSSNGQCAAADVSSCTCFGGAARRRAYLGPLTGTPYTSEKRVALDTGSYFSAGGHFYAAYNGSASGDFFADSGYAAYGLSYRDFNAGAGLSDLANYLYHIRNAAGTAGLTVPPATVTNLNETAGTELAGLVSDFTLVPLGVDDADHTINHTMAVLSLTDPTHLAATQPVAAARLLPFARALSVTVFKIKSLPVVPSVIVVMVTDLPTSAAQLAAAGSMRAAKTAALTDLARAAIGVDVFILGASDVDVDYPYLMKNWAGDDVLIVPAASAVYGTRFTSATFGTVIQELTMQLTTAGKLVTTAGSVTSNAIELNCSSDEHATTKAALLSWEAGASTKLGEVLGTLMISHHHIFTNEGGSRPCRITLPSSGSSKVCGCRVGPLDGWTNVLGGLFSGGGGEGAKHTSTTSKAAQARVLTDAFKLKMQRALGAKGNLPTDLQGEDSLICYPGQLLQTSKTRPDGWAFGSVCYDPAGADRPPLGIDGISLSTGWFPLAATDLPTADQMAELQKMMGGGDVRCRGRAEGPRHVDAREGPHAPRDGACRP